MRYFDRLMRQSQRSMVMKTKIFLASVLIICFFVNAEIVTDDDIYNGIQRIAFSGDPQTEQESKAFLDILKNQRTTLKEEMMTWCLKCKYAIHFGDCLAVSKQHQFSDEVQQKLALNIIMAKVENFFELVHLKYDIKDDAFDDMMRLAILGLQTKKQIQAKTMT